MCLSIATINNFQGDLTNVSLTRACVTGRDLLKGGRLTKRYTIVPLTKIDARTATSDKRSAAHKATSGRSQLALDCVDAAPEVERAMKYAFGNAFVCRDAADARKVAFLPKGLGSRCISLEGDDFNPSGTLTGGSRGRNLPVLARLNDLCDAEGHLSHHQVCNHSGILSCYRNIGVVTPKFIYFSYQS